ncbi:hypothetical protein J1N35_034776 [Gossypium stocksii]|uniref:RNase H type-1 domain-containing protein n=1 Tax=Gossypium stocksii TaxID=47602 RepID=A0A9D3USZ7_9ROSI|nr:hypothetical protein J1N35_034776 [Gossypium stocksii]
MPKKVPNENVPSVAVETIACIQSIQVELDLGLMDTEVKGDALTVIKKLLHEREDKSEIVALIRDGKCLGKQFCTCIFK